MVRALLWCDDSRCSRIVPETKPRAPITENMTPAKILIVEDDQIVARDIQQQLLRIGHAVVGLTGRGEQAVELALSALPDLVLMDIRLQGEMDGIEAAQRIRTEA